MKKKFLVIFLVGVFGIAGILGIGTSSANAETLGLALLIDASGSINSTEYALQRDAYKSIFEAPNFATNFLGFGGPNPSTLVASVYTFDTVVAQPIGWTTIQTNAQANAFGNQFTFGRPSSGVLTNTGQAIIDAAAGLNGLTVDRMVIDISTDGNPTTGPDAITAAMNAWNAPPPSGITINAIGVGNGIDAGLLNSLVAPSGGFVLTATDFNTFAQTLETKIDREINPIPEPGTMLLLGVGLVGVAGLGRRKFFKK